jgi:hypothetical protein
LWNRFREHYAKNTDVLVVKGTTLQFNPTFDPETINAALQSDPQLYGAEYNSEWRSDLQAFVSRDAVEACVVEGRRELAPAHGVRYCAFIDPSGGSSDSMTLAIAHKDKEQIVLDCIREWRPPFSPEGVVNECVDVLKIYGVQTVTGDRFGGDWVREPFIRRGIAYLLADRPKSDLYRAFLPTINSHRVQLLDHPKLVSQLSSLERRTTRGSGRDIIDHPRGFKDDVANSVAGAADLASGRRENKCAVFGFYSSEGIKIVSGQQEGHRWDGPLPGGGYASSR